MALWHAFCPWTIQKRLHRQSLANTQFLQTRPLGGPIWRCGETYAVLLTTCFKQLKTTTVWFPRCHSIIRISRSSVNTRQNTFLRVARNASWATFIIFTELAGDQQGFDPTQCQDGKSTVKVQDTSHSEIFPADGQGPIERSTKEEERQGLG